MKVLFLLISIIYFIVSNDATKFSKSEQKLTLRGRIIFPNGPRMPVESDGTLSVVLQDVSLADAPAIVVARGTGKAIRFPMAFAIKYSPQQITEGHRYSLQVSIRNINGELLYTNDAHISVIPTGLERTKLIDVPVILVKKATQKVNKKQWLELVGKHGKEAVNIIKLETGFKNVMVVPEGSMVTIDYRTDRVRVFINNQGMVKSIPTIA